MDKLAFNVTDASRSNQKPICLEKSICYVLSKQANTNKKNDQTGGSNTIKIKKILLE